MAYQALLFYPDDKTARAVTQVLSELEFNVEPCTETFAAVKKLMAAHFDAIVVDCDNEQNATLLFKSARNSTLNQTALAVAVVEGQAGVAKAFRIGANLVLTKPINIEQAKGTLRVARGLLRKSEAGKAGAAAAGTAVSTPPAAQAKPRVSEPMTSTPPPAVSVAPPAAPEAKTATKAAWPGQADSPSKPVTTEPEPAHKSSLTSASSPTSEVAPAPKKPAQAAHASKPSAPAPAASFRAAMAAKSASKAMAAGGAAAAPAPARETPPTPSVKDTTSPPVSNDAVAIETPAATSSHTVPLPPPSFTFGGANLPAKSGGSQKILLVIVAVVLVGTGLYLGWTHFSGHHPPADTPAPNVQPDAPKPMMSAPASSVQTPKPAAPPAPAASAPIPRVSEPDSVTDDSTSDSEDSSETASSHSLAKPAAKPAATPRVVKGGAVRNLAAKTAAPDAVAPSVIGIAAPSANGPLPNLPPPSDVAHPVLQRMTVSQGVSQGLLVKKVAPVYPPAALRMHMEGSVQLMATISKTGDISDVKALSGDPQFTRAATDAVKRWKYKPYLLSGEPVEIQTQITVVFKVPH